jgi:hypothetical protein
VAVDWSTATNQALEAARQQFLIAAALENQKIVDASHPSSSIRSVNGNAGAPDTAIQINPTASVIRYSYNYMDAVAQFALQTLRDLSPVGYGSDPHPGLYRHSHILFIDGHNVTDAKNWLPGQILYVSNPEPYARQVELGSGVSFKAPHNVYEQAQPIIAAKFSDSVTVQFTFMPINFSDPALRSGWLSRQPTLIISAR